METRTEDYDVVVVGGKAPGAFPLPLPSPGRKLVFLAERNGYLGGNAAIGLPLLGFPDQNGKQIVGESA